MEKQAEKARIYLKKKEELKTFDVNMFLLEMERIDKQLKEVQDNFQIADGQLKEKNETYTNIKSEYEKMERDVEAIEEKITSIRDTISNSSVTKGKLEGQINVLNEQIHTAKMTDEHMRKRLETIESEKKERLSTKSGYEKEKADLDGQLTNISERKETAQNQYQEVQEKAAKLKEEIENGKNELIQLLNQKASIKARIQRNDTMVEQINIRRAQLNQRLLARKSEETDLESVLEEYQLKLDETNQEIAKLREKSAKMENERREWKQKSIETTKTLEESLAKYHKNQSRLESLKNIAERYDGYGNSIRKVMEQKAANKGLLGVVSDLIQVDKKYEIAIETALGGNIQNIVTEDEETAKKMISYLKANRFGRATFLPITSVDGRGNFKNHDALKEKGVIGLANTLVKTDAKYEGVIAYLLGRVVVTENIDHAIALARKNHYSLHIVTLEGEYLSPGGSMAGGAFKNSSNLLARKREVEELEKKVQDLDDAVKDSRKRLEEIKTAQALLADDMEENRKNLQELILAQNTAKMNVDRVVSKKNESETVYQGLQTEHKEMEGQLAEIEQEKAKIAKESEDALAREKEIGVQNETYQRELEEQDIVIEKAGNELSRIQLEEANLRQKAEFVTLNIERIETELAKFDAECEQVQKEAEEAKEEVQKKLSDIEEIKKTILASDGANENLTNELQEALHKKEELSASYKGFFQKQEEISKEITELEKEIFRLNSQREKLEDAHTYQNNYMWEEYELTLHAALELRNEEYQNLSELKKEIANIKDEIRKLGDVNVNAIEDYKEISERYTFLKGQHDDLIEAEQTLVNIIEELDTGMRKQFLEKFAEIQKEFDKVFKELFGGGKGSLELVEDEDILECGIRIIAQPPGKKLQNMMQMSGGEKSLTAISLLFAIQNLKPSPFCLLDEIEAALDDSNVSRFAKYLHKLTKNTQFIVITHRRGTMAAADRLYGITMQEKGVSTLVSVNLIEDELDK